jgi:hypothetical protein
MPTPEYLIPWLKLRYVFANRFDPSCHVTAEAWIFWF